MANKTPKFWQSLDSLPYDTVVLFIQQDGNVFQDYWYDSDKSFFTARKGGRKVIAWAHVPPLNEVGA